MTAVASTVIAVVAACALAYLLVSMYWTYPASRPESPAARNVGRVLLASAVIAAGIGTWHDWRLLLLWLVVLGACSGVRFWHMMSEGSRDAAATQRGEPPHCLDPEWDALRQTRVAGR